MNLTPRSPMRQRWFAVLALVAVLLVIQGSSGLNPVLYSAKNASTTGFHQDLVSTGDLSRTDAALVLQEWASSLNLTGSVVHNLKNRDFKSAEGGIQELRSAEHNLRDLVERLNLTDTDVGTFEKDNYGNWKSLHGLLNQTREFDDLQHVETTFRGQKNISGLKAVDLRGEDLRMEIRGMYKQYSDRSSRIITLSQKFGLDTSVYEQSLTDFAAILADIDAVQDARSVMIFKMIQDYKAASAISLNVLPDRGVYGDTLSMAGTANAPAGTEVTVFVDGVQTGSAVIDTSGRFSLPYRIEQIGAHTHTAFASIDSDISDVSNFTVESRNTTISFAARLIEENGTWQGIGTGRLLTEDGIPVRGGLVSVSIDGQTSWDSGITRDDGTFSLATERITPGSQTLNARFDPTGFPLTGSESAPVAVEGPSSIGWFASLIYFFAIAGAGIGGVLFLRGRHATGALPSDGTVVAAPARPAEPPSTLTIEEARMMADQVTVTNEGRVDRDETVALTYRRLVRELEAKNPDLRLRSRTPRDLAMLFADQPFGAQLRALVEIHERIRYAEHEPTEEDLYRMREAFISIITEGSGH